MPHCPNCGDSVKSEHRYCGSCGEPLSSEVEEDEGIPPRSSVASGSKFLSGRSLEYISKVRDGELDWDPDAIEYANLKRDVGHAMADFRVLVTLKEADLTQLVFDWIEEGDMGREFEKMNYEDKRRYIALVGLLTLPRLYDRSFDFDWEDELIEKVNEVFDEVNEDS